MSRYQWKGVECGCVCYCINPMFLLVNNSDSPSLVEHLQQGCGSSCYTLLTVVPGSMKCLIPYACQLASCSMGISYYVPYSCSYDLTFLVFFSFFFFSLSGALQPPFYPGCFLTEPWDGLSGFVISHLLLGVHSSMTLVKLIMIGYHCDCLGG